MTLPTVSTAADSKNCGSFLAVFTQNPPSDDVVLFFVNSLLSKTQLATKLYVFTASFPHAYKIELDSNLLYLSHFIYSDTTSKYIENLNIKNEKYSHFSRKKY